MKKNISIRVSGKVQGVFFRAFTKEKADELGVVGFVRNESNGDVYIEAEGESALLEALVGWCRQGPRLALVKDCLVTSGELKNFHKFTIAR